jgi:hypothetical protein
MKIVSADFQLFRKDRRIGVLKTVGAVLHLFFMAAVVG